MCVCVCACVCVCVSAACLRVCLCVDQGFMDYAGWAIKVGIVASVENFV